MQHTRSPEIDNGFELNFHDKKTLTYGLTMVISLELYETLGYIMVRGDPQEHFLDFDFCKKI